MLRRRSEIRAFVCIVACCAALGAAAWGCRRPAPPAKAKPTAPTTSSAATKDPLVPLAPETGRGVPREDDWPMFRGWQDSRGVAKSSPGEKPQLLWSWRATSGKHGIRSTAAIVDGVAYVGTDESEVVAVDLARGRAVWRYKTQNSVLASPCVWGGRVFVGDEDGRFHAIDSATGKMLWKLDAGAQIDAPAVVTEDGQSVIVGAYNAKLFSLDVATGKERWVARAENYVYAMASLADGVATLGSCDGFFRVIDQASGVQRFTVNVDSYIAAAPARVAGLAYLPTLRSAVYCFDPSDGKIVWTYRPKGWENSTEIMFYASAAVVDGHVVFGGNDNLVRSLRTADGTEEWTFTTQGGVDSSPVAVGPRVYVGSADGKLYGLNLATGRQEWVYDCGGPLSASPAVGEGRLVIGSEDGMLYCFGTRE